VYFGKKGESGQEFTEWDAGGYEVVGEGRVRVSTATDAEITYDFSLSGETLHFTDPDGCRFDYRRIEHLNP